MVQVVLALGGAAGLWGEWYEGMFSEMKAGCLVCPFLLFFLCLFFLIRYVVSTLSAVYDPMISWLDDDGFCV